MNTNSEENRENDEANAKISFDDFAKVEMKIGRIISAERVEGSEKLLKLRVDFSEDVPRQVISGIAKQFVATVAGENEEATAEIRDLFGNSFVFVTNLEPRTIMGLESQAMIVAGTAANGLALMSPTIDLPAGTKLS